MKYINFEALINFLVYAGSGFILLAMFTFIYTWVTPYNESKQIQEGKKAPAVALGGAMLGFTFPLLSMQHYGINLTDFIIWACIACLLQIIIFKLLYRFIPMKVDEDNQSIAIVYAFTSICIGLINAFSLIPV
jgi:putative membrane protein